MRIDDSNRAALPKPATVEAAREKSSGNLARGLDQTSSSDAAEISALTQSLRSARADRLEALRTEVEAGRYQVNASELASRILDHHRSSGPEDPSKPD
jgi:flagellar biosynthesis anti-sigma factor FlgM